MAQHLASIANLPLNTVEKLQKLIQAPSVTPSDAGTLSWLATRLHELGFEILLHEEVHGVKNLVAKRCFSTGPNFAFAGHVDVVPANDKGWLASPFSGDVIDGCIIGRGAADMKGGIAAMLSATEQMCAHDFQYQGTFYWLLTSDEEGEAEYGSKRIAQFLTEQNIALDACLVGEPTSDKTVGDTIKNGRRGALSGRVQINGKAGHVAYPENTVNAAHIAGEIVAALTQLVWWKDEAGSKTHLQVTGITVPNIVDNLVPSECEITFNIRYSHAYRSHAVCELVESVLEKWQNHLAFVWERPCEPYYTGANEQNCFLSLTEKAIYQATGQYPTLSTSGGTSDGRFFASSCTQVIECGVRNHTIHQVNEHVPICDLQMIEEIYLNVLKEFFVA
ncbi:Succinyl-diaminopimelate desuccinylase [Pseudoalteromonas holothuriae]|uniref:Succinyl-diaminopimelate desuccinylase n=1 Tax=Pseudoalteromonas holothuriae TaxID=2963714 RepID=A0A9W4QZ18_9GAMM|nr:MULTISPECIES: succinyl-diaminopimelate desuccinylase [unclassified Pseudoalteromonas]CAH9059701.1 Succinyl-diaminopimelate desuccinylase [Pseudoalteromonas sp. CIP111854]CAH9064146.1 Succinyl-diaminopimelate desuccinylase [Pseudoalteromonas sp. CIP111951]